MDRKVSGALCTCSSSGSGNSFLSIGLGVNLNSSPVPVTSVCLKEIIQESNINVDRFVEELAKNVMSYFSKADRHGFEGQLLTKIESRLEFMNEQVNIYDGTLTTVIHTGKFIGINKYGHAKLL